MFFDCNSVTVDKQQVTRSFVQQAVGSQRAKNITGNIMLAEIQGLRRTRLAISDEALPDDPALLQAYTNPQTYSAALVYKAHSAKGEPLNPPIITPPAPIPPEIAATFNNIDGTMQGVLGSYQAQQGNLPVNISEGTLLAGIGQSNAAAKPPIINYTASMNQVIKCVLGLIPKTYKTPRTMPVIDPSGNRTFIKINDPQNKDTVLDYEPNCLDLYVTTGVSFEQQKKDALQTMVQLSAGMPALGSLLNGKGLPIVLSNLDIKDGDRLQTMAEEAVKAQENAPPPPPPPEFILQQQNLQIKQQELALKAQEMQLYHDEKMSQIDAEKKKTESQEVIESMKMQVELMRIINDREEMTVKLRLAQNEDDRALLDQQIKVRDQAISQMRMMMDAHLKAMDIHGKMKSQTAMPSLTN